MLSAAALAALLVLGCGAGDGTPGTKTRASARAPRAPALCGRLRARITGRVSAPAATELSGLVLSRSQPGVLWTHNDSGDRPRVLAVAADGRLLGDVALTGAENVDWEDVAIGRGRVSGAGATTTGGVLLVGDIGDNLARRTSIAVYRVAEPRVGVAGATTTAPASRIALRYPDGPRDAEALLVDPTDGALVIVAKSYSGRAGVYVADRPSTGATPATLRRSGRLSLGVREAVTAGDVSADGRTIVLRTYDRAFVWVRRDGERVGAALRRRPCAAQAGLLVEGQGEALALTAAGDAFYTVPEGSRPAIRRYAPAE
ncbi:MAG: hypothetical protein QOJ63_3613 [Solirubrobacteraceae bacterium]|nr:hypothetical protein [Solirubrobacteraceae bacterium]